tara:strand:+ start:218 stop:592 length:375 start_codon:yes stop_codon:yes gene_type:complete
MSSYIAQSGSSVVTEHFGQATKQVPNTAPGGIARFSHATAPAAEAITKRPSHVIINNPGTYAFAYESGSNIAGGVYITSSFLSASAGTGTSQGSIKLEINPVAWRKTDVAGTTGDITFVYVKVR